MSNPINLGVKWKLLFSSFWKCPWIWDLNLNCQRYVRKHDTNLNSEIDKNESKLIHCKLNFLNHFCITWPFYFVHMKAEDLRISKLFLLLHIGASKPKFWSFKCSFLYLSWTTTTMMTLGQPTLLADLNLVLKPQPGYPSSTGWGNWGMLRLVEA